MLSSRFFHVQPTTRLPPLGCNLLILTLCVCSSDFQSGPRFFRDLLLEWFPQEAREQIAENIRHVDPLCCVSYLAEKRWRYPFPPSNVFALHPIPSVNMQLPKSHFSFWASRQNGWGRRGVFVFSLLLSSPCRFWFSRWQTSQMFRVKSARVRDYYLIASVSCWLRIKSQLS